MLRYFVLAALLALITCHTITNPAVAGEASVAHLYWVATGSQGGVFRALATGEIPEQLAQVRAIDYLALDTTGGRLVYAELDVQRNGRLMRSALDGSGRTVLAEVEAPNFAFDVEIDAGAGWVYWTDESAIRRVPLAGGASQLVVTAAAEALALDLEAGHLYYYAGSDIFRSGLDGSGAVNLGTVGPNGDELEIDTVNNRLYYSKSASNFGLRLCDLALASCTLIGSQAFKVEIANGLLYYSSSGGVWRADLDGQNPVQLQDDVPKSFAIDAGTLEFYGAEGNLWRSALDGSASTPLVGAAGQVLHDIAVDVSAGRLFLTEDDHAAVLGTPWDGGTLTPVLGSFDLPEDHYRGLALDPASSRLYFADLDDGVLRAVDTDGQNAAVIVAGLTQPHDVALDLVAGKIYWTEGVEDGPGAGAAIGRANLDGTGAETLLSGLSRGVRGLAVDPAGGKMYWTDHFDDELWWADLDGGSPAALPVVVNNPHDLAVDALASALYWTEGASSAGDPNGLIRRANLDGTAAVTVLAGLDDHLRDLVVVHHEALHIFFDGFESGTTGAWSSATP